MTTLVKDNTNSVSVVCAVMNRTNMLKLSLSSWLLFPEIGEIVIVDWSSRDDMKWVLDIDPRIKLVRVEGEKYFNISQAFNLAIDHATKEFILKLDVDYVLNPYYNFFNAHPLREGHFYHGNWKRLGWGHPLVYLNGLHYSYRKDFLSVRGYNENFNNYGKEDDELCFVFQQAGKTRLDLKYDYSVLHMPHSNELRTENYVSKNRAINDLVWEEFHTNKNRRIINWETLSTSDRYIVTKIKKNT